MYFFCLASGAGLNLPVKDVTNVILNEWKVVIHFNFHLSRLQKRWCSLEPENDQGSSGGGNGSLALTFHHVDISSAINLVMYKPASITEEKQKSIINHLLHEMIIWYRSTLLEASLPKGRNIARSDTAYQNVITGSTIHQQQMSPAIV